MYKLRKVGIKNAQRCNIKFPFRLNENLIKIVACLTFDGHLSLNQHCFLYTGKDKNSITPFKKLIKQIFGIGGILRFKDDGQFGPSCEFRVFNNTITKLLFLAGTPDGNKTLQAFTIPKWILRNKEMARTYLQVAFDCEGSVWKEKNGRVGINFTMAKCENLIGNAVEFIETMKKLLFDYFDIKSTKITVIDGNTRKDGIKTKFLRFKISESSLKEFKDKIGFINSIKAKKLNEYIN